MLLFGPPGTGKTLLRPCRGGRGRGAVLSISGPICRDVRGVGASRVRDLSDQAKQNQPCIVFIDEIDAVGRHRGRPRRWSRRTRADANQLLTEMDGFDDLFHEDRPSSIIDEVVATIVASRHIGLFLTKRAERIAAYFSAPQHEKILQRRQEKLWLGFSAERQHEFDARWAHMRALSACGWTVFVSVAPMLKPVLLPPDFLVHGERVWCICAGEEK